MLEIARGHRVSRYEAYLELAIREGVALATQDARLSEAAARLGVPLDQ